MSGLCAERQAGDGSARIVAPIGSAEPDEGRNEGDAVRARYRLGQPGDFGGVGKSDEFGHEGRSLPGDRNVAFERIGDAGCRAPGNGA
jgi:hypothetical protein